MELTRLTNGDWDDLLPGKAISLGKTSLIIHPLGIGDLKDAALKLISSIDKVNVDLDSDEGLTEMFAVVLECAPEVMECATGLHRDDLKRLPIDKGVELIRTVIEVNIKSRDSLLKNLQALVALFRRKKAAKAPNKDAQEL